MKKFLLIFSTFITLVVLGSVGIKASAQTEKVYRADAVSYQNGQYQIRCNALSPYDNHWTWTDNGIPVASVTWVNANGSNIANGPASSFKAGMYFTINPTVKDWGGGHFEKNGITVASGTPGAVYWEKYYWGGASSNYSWLTAPNLNSLLYGTSANNSNPQPNPSSPSVPSKFDASVVAKGFLKTFGVSWSGAINTGSTYKLASGNIANASYNGYSQCMALVAYYLAQYGKPLNGVVYGYSAVSASRLPQSSTPVVGGIFSVPANGLWSGVSVGGTGHAGIVIAVNSGKSFTTLENNYAGGFYVVVHPWSDVSHARYTLAV